MAKSRSASPSKVKATKAPAGPVSAQLANTVTLAWFMLIGLTGMVVPKTLMALYEIPLTNLEEEGKKNETLVVMMFQGWMMWMMMGTGILSIIRREGDTRTKGLVCLTSAVGMAIFLVKGEMGGHQLWQDLGMPDTPVNFNRALFAGYLVLNVMGWQDAGSPQPDFSLASAPGCWAEKYAAVISAGFGLMMLFNIDGLFEIYKFSTGDDQKITKMWIAAIFTGMGQTLIANAITLIFTLGANCASDINRWLFAFYLGMFMVSCVQTTTMGLVADTMPAEGQLFNSALWAVGCGLAWKKMVGL